jgi:diguanylate cyclase (GGDEF)-like protein/PAS domain S-box-containing protein
MGAARDGSGWPDAISACQMREVLDHAHEAFVAMDASGLVIDWNPQAQQTFGWSADEAMGRVLADLIIPQRHRAAHAEGLRRYLDGGAARILGRRLELDAIDRTGREFPVELTITRHEGLAAPCFYAFVHDISKRRLSERLLRAQHAITRVFAQAKSSDEAMRGLLAALGEAMGWQLGSWWSPTEDGEALRCRSVWRAGDVAVEFEQASMALELARGAALPGRAWATGQPAWTADLAADPSFPRARMATRAGLHASLCVPVVARREFRGVVEFFGAQAGEPDLATRRILDTLAEQIGGFMSVLDQRSELVRKLERLALTDELTGLANRRAWQQSLERELARARRHGEPLCVAMLDLDHFKRFNDAHGHQAGDRLLREIAQTWRSQLRASDILARYGGEEFALVSPAWPLKAATAVLARVRAATPKGQTCSAGLAVFSGSESAEELVARADAALYEAKAQGRDRTIVADAVADADADGIRHAGDGSG